jgi:hypothetical protein
MTQEDLERMAHAANICEEREILIPHIYLRELRKRLHILSVKPSLKPQTPFSLPHKILGQPRLAVLNQISNVVTANWQ